MPASITAFVLLTSLGFGQHDKDYLSSDRLGQDNRITIGVTVKIHSDVLNEDRDILIYLPDDYTHSQRKYPVIYLLDGNYFFLPTAGMVEFLSKINNAPKMIVAAIVNTDRFRDFSPSPSGDAARFSSFLKNELIPYMNKNYRTESYNIFMGHSMGGLFVIYTLLNEPQLFNAYFAMSPALHMNGRSEVSKADQVFNSQVSLKKFLFITYSNGDGKNIRSSTDEVVHILEEHAPQDLKWKFHFLPNDRHNTSPIRSVYNGLEFLFSQWIYLGEDDAEKMAQHYESLADEFGFTCKPTIDAVTSRGRNLLRKGNVSEAIKVYQYLVKIYPLSADGYESLGEAYMKAGNKEPAINNYEKSLKLDPQNTGAVENLKKLRGDK